METGGNNGKMLTIEQASQKLGVSTKTIRNYLKQGRLTFQKVPTGKGPHQYLIHADSLGTPLGISSTNVFQVEQQLEAQVEEQVEDLKRQSPLIQATYRIGYLEGQLELSRKMLTEGETFRQSALLEKEQALQDKEKALAEKKELELQVHSLMSGIQEKDQELEKKRQLEDEVSRLSSERAALAARVAELELPWWKKLFVAKSHSKPAPSVGLSET
jgi:excisionase family DNA binding protein